MSQINYDQVRALFRHQAGSFWTGGVHMMSKFYEYVPFTLDGKQHVMEFLYPQYLNDIGFYGDMLFRTKDNGLFIPKREHRTLRLLSVDNQGELTPMETISVLQTQYLAQALYQVVVAYYQQNRQASQFFYEAEPALGAFIRNELPAQLRAQQSALTLTFHDELAEPFYGFSVFADLTTKGD